VLSNLILFDSMCTTIFINVSLMKVIFILVFVYSILYESPLD